MRYQPKLNTPASIQFHQSTLVDSMEDIQNDLHDLNKLHIGLVAYKTLTTSLEDIDNGDYSSETVLDANRALHQIADVTGEEELRPKVELDSEAVLSVSTEGILSTAFKAILKILTWIITAPIRFVRWLFDRTKIIKAKKAMASADGLKAEEMVKKTDQGGLVRFDLKHMTGDVKGANDINTYAKQESGAYQQILKGIDLESSEVGIFSKLSTVDMIVENFSRLKFTRGINETTCLSYIYKQFMSRESIPPYYPYRLIPNPTPRANVSLPEKDILVNGDLGKMIASVTAEQERCYNADLTIGNSIASQFKDIQSTCERIKANIEKRQGDNVAVPEELSKYVEYMSLYMSTTIRNTQVMDTMSSDLNTMFDSMRKFTKVEA